MKITLVLLTAIILSGCGWVDRKKASLAGGATKVCIDGVMYLQFTSGASVAFTTDGTVKTCSM
jgi:uncharacterized protein YceK